MALIQLPIGECETPYHEHRPTLAFPPGTHDAGLVAKVRGLLGDRELAVHTVDVVCNNEFYWHEVKGPEFYPCGMRVPDMYVTGDEILPHLARYTRR